jgi:hypothetical protein
MKRMGRQKQKVVNPDAAGTSHGSQESPAAGRFESGNRLQWPFHDMSRLCTGFVGGDTEREGFGRDEVADAAGGK